MLQRCINILCFHTTFFYFFLQARDSIQERTVQNSKYQTAATPENFNAVTMVLFTSFMKTLLVNFVISILLLFVPPLTTWLIAPTSSQRLCRVEYQNKPIYVTEEIETIPQPESQSPIVTPKPPNIHFYITDVRLISFLFWSWVACAVINYYLGKILTYARKDYEINTQTRSARADIFLYINYGIVLVATILYITI